MVIGSGMVTLIGPKNGLYDIQYGWRILLQLLCGFFMVFPYIILGGTMRVAGGAYSIVTNLSGVSGRLVMHIRTWLHKLIIVRLH